MMRFRSKSGIGQIAVTVLIAMIVVGTASGYAIGYLARGEPSITTQGSNGSNVSNVTVTSTVPNFTTTVTTYEPPPPQTTITWTQFQTNIVSENDSLSNLMVSNLSLGGFPDAIGFNQKTDVLYVEYAYNTTNLAVINGSSNSPIKSIPLGNATQATPMVNPDTNTVYVGNVIINGSTNSISGYLSKDETVVGVDSSRNILYATNTTFNGNNGTTTVYEISGTNNEVISSLSFAGVPEAGDNPYAMNDQTGVIYFAVCTNSCGFSESYVIAVGPSGSSGLSVVSKIPLGKLVFNMATDSSRNMIYVTTLQNLFIAINATTNQIVDQIPITAYANELRGITVDSYDGEIFLAGSPDCQGFSGCGVNTLYVLSGQNYGILATFVTSGPFTLQFDSANNQTYVLYYYSHYVTSVKIPHYHETFLIP